MSRLIGYHGPVLAQVNDYITAGFPSNGWDTLRKRGMRRLLSLGWRHWQEGNLLRSANTAICNSQATATAAQNAYGLAGDRIAVIYKAVDSAAFRRPQLLPPDPMAGQPVGARVALVGTDWRTKGLDLLLDAIGRLETEFPNVLLVAIGPDREDLRLRSVLESSGVQDRVILVGRAPADKVASYLWHSDILCLASRSEAFGVALLEGMAAGLPIVAPQVGGIPEIVRTEQHGLLFEPGRSTALTAALARLLGNPSERKAFGAEGARRALEFSVGDMVRRVKNIYQKFSAKSISET
jgi:glycosyltransferase involved in cell wall biosynthesis